MRFATDLLRERVRVLEGACKNQEGVVRGAFVDDNEVRLVIELANGQVLQKSANSVQVLKENQCDDKSLLVDLLD